MRDVVTTRNLPAASRRRPPALTRAGTRVARNGADPGQPCACGGGCPACAAAAVRVDPPSSPLEREADAAADAVARGASVAGRSLASGATAGAPRAAQRRAIPAPPAPGVVPPGGEPLDAATRNFMEARFDRDFGDVRVHAGPAAHEAAAALKARAFTVGRDIVFGNGAAPAGDRRLLAHELAHVVQQAQGAAAQRVQRQGVDVDEDVDEGPEESPEPSGGDPLADAVRIVRSAGSGLGASELTEDLVAGIERAEQRFLTLARRVAEFLRLGSSMGPTQLTASAIAQVESAFPAAVASFAASYGPAPADWSAKATHPAWYRFYTAAYAAWSIDEAERTFQASDSTFGRVNLGIVMYLGAFASIRDLRRRIADERGIERTAVTWSMIEDHADVLTFQDLNDIVNYVMTVRGLPDVPLGASADRP